MFLKMAWYWRSWDSEFTIEVLTTLLRTSAKVLRKGCGVNSEKTYRRCMTAAGLLDKAYNDFKRDKTISYLISKNKMYIEKVGIFGRLKINYIADKRIYDGMYSAALKRSNKEEAALKKEAWAYLHKHIESFWD
jgi:hypothetical protein